DQASAGERRGRLMIGAAVVAAGLLLVVGLGVIFALKAPATPAAGSAASPVTAADAGAMPTPPITNPHGHLPDADAGAATPSPDAGAGGSGSEPAEEAGAAPRLARAASASEFAFAGPGDGAALLPLQPHTPVW